ncbi:hypothetical protein PSHT_14766 [Puccinia striiformis]|uniref:Cwf15/Cwc15 cell cycle control protein n=1 Tax=Puccinia striiformis TaxID=27350 RepID=A0A2S4UIG3_9BASI|nr:hypothetical protein PSHT_14766 [Puccinia striiformis]
MSSAHRPTWTPAMGKDARMNTKQYSSRDIAGHTKLKYRQPGQDSISDLARRDLKLELEIAERESAAKRRRAAGLLPINEDKNEKQSETKLLEDGTDEESKTKRRKMLKEALLADKDDSESEGDSDDDKRGAKRHGKSKATSVPLSDHDGNDNDDSDDDESETAELLRELEKIKRERAEEKERQERESNANAALDKETVAAVGNPLLNLKAALNQNGNLSPTNSVTTSSTRDVNEKPKKEFVNDLLRTEFHRRFLKKFIA